MSGHSFIFDIKVQSSPPYEGALLVAEPFLRENYFNHAVICLVDYAPGGTAMGLALNKLTHYSLNDLVGDVTVDRDIPVFCGGPMSSDHLYCIHTLGDIVPESRHVTDDLYVGGDFATIIDYVNSGYPIDGKVRFCMGYSGWEAGQLEGEIRRHVWAVTTVGDTDTLLTGSENRYWHRQVRTMGSPYRGWLYHPQDPKMN
ncbi:MAG: YqgE/AlgH family protein [Pseudoflavonifractor sp.]|nr:YqgE/AlgH family protein [Pseudoflavonifractor sp.]